MKAVVLEKYQEPLRLAEVPKPLSARGEVTAHLGVHVIATASARDAEKVRGLGAEEVIDYRSQDFAAELAGAPVDVVLNTQGDDVTLRSMQVLRRACTVISIVGTPEPTVVDRLGGSALLKPALAWMSWRLRAEARKRGVTYRFLFITPDGEGLREVSALAASGAVRPVVDRVLPLEQAVEALGQLLSGGAKGKVLVTTDPATTTRA